MVLQAMALEEFAIMALLEGAVAEELGLPVELELASGALDGVTNALEESTAALEEEAPTLLERAMVELEEPTIWLPLEVVPFPEDELLEDVFPFGGAPMQPTINVNRTQGMEERSKRMTAPDHSRQGGQVVLHVYQTSVRPCVQSGVSAVRSGTHRRAPPAGIAQCGGRVRWRSAISAVCTWPPDAQERRWGFLPVVPGLLMWEVAAHGGSK